MTEAQDNVEKVIEFLSQETETLIEHYVSNNEYKYLVTTLVIGEFEDGVVNMQVKHKGANENQEMYDIITEWGFDLFSEQKPPVNIYDLESLRNGNR